MIGLVFGNGVYDLARTDTGAVAQDDGLATSILVALLTWRRAEPDDPQQDPLNPLGFWGDTYPDIEGDQLGSRLWLLNGQKVTQDLLRAAEGYADEALRVFVDTGVASSVEVVATPTDDRDALDLEIFLERPDELAERWLGAWEASTGI